MPNPYLQQSANDIATNLTQNWQQNALPSINGGAMLAGGFGGSRQGVAQALSANGLNQAIGQAQNSLYSNAYQTDQNIAAQQAMQQAQLASNEKLANMSNDTQRLGLSNNYNLGLGQLGLGQYSAETTRGLGYGQLQQQGDQNAFNNQLAGFNAQLQGLGFLNGLNTTGLGIANQQQQTPLQNLSTLANLGMGIGGQGQSATTPNYSPLQGAMAGGLTVAQLLNLLNKPGG